MSDLNWSLDSQNLPVAHHHDIYPGIEPSTFEGSMKGKVVFVTGASRGIGEATARAFAQSGASLFLAARKSETMEAVKSGIVKNFPGAAVVYHATDVVKPDEVKAAVEVCIKAFGKIDVVISNSGVAEGFIDILAVDPAVWWYTFEVNVKGAFNVAHFTLPYLAKSQGRLIFVSSIGAQYVTPGLSAYQTTKHTVNRLVEFIVTEHGDVPTFSLHPGGIKTAMSTAAGPEVAKYLIDDVQLPAWTMVRLAQGNDDYLSGRYVSANWDLDEVLSKWKESIVRDDALKNRLSLPQEVYRS